MSVILGIDPGGVTGAVKYQSRSHKFTDVRQFFTPDHHNELSDWIENAVPDVVVYERFDYRGGKRSVDLSPVEYIGVIKDVCLYNGFDMMPQQQLKGDKGLWTDAKLKVLNLYEPGMGHAMDAIRQVLYYVTVTLGDDHWVRLYGELTT